jgi:RimJ/RimL family protein N-acetyltransferase
MTNLILRQANLADARQLFELRNHLKVREQSHNTDEIKFNEHKKWLEKVVLDECKQILIAEVNENFVGMVRFELVDDAYLMSWAMSPDFQGCGLGKETVKMASKTMGHDTLKAEIKQNNLASIKIAEHIGMRLIKEIKGTLFYQK